MEHSLNLKSKQIWNWISMTLVSHLNTPWTWNPNIWILFQWNWFQNSTPHALEIRFMHVSIGFQVHGVLNSETSFIEIYFIFIHRISKVSQLNTPACRPWVYITNMISMKKVSQFSNTLSWLLIYFQLIFFLNKKFKDWLVRISIDIHLLSIDFPSEPERDLRISKGWYWYYQ